MKRETSGFALVELLILFSILVLLFMAIVSTTSKHFHEKRLEKMEQTVTKFKEQSKDKSQPSTIPEKKQGLNKL